jgi:hypothetical protein
LRLNLKSFHLSNSEDEKNPENFIGFSGANEIAKGLSHLKNLRILDIGLKGNHIMNPGLIELSQVISKLKSLEKL